MPIGGWPGQEFGKVVSICETSSLGQGRKRKGKGKGRGREGWGKDHTNVSPLFLPPFGPNWNKSCYVLLFLNKQFCTLDTRGTSWLGGVHFRNQVVPPQSPLGGKVWLHA